MSKADRLSFRASILAVSGVTMVIISIILATSFGKVAGVPSFIVTVLVGATAGITAVRATYQRDVENRESGNKPSRIDYF